MKIISFLNDGGPIMYVIIIFSMIALYVFWDKWLQFHRIQINVEELLSGLKNPLRRKGFIEATTLCNSYPGPVARILYASIQAYEKGFSDDEIRKAIEDSAMVEVPRMEKRIKFFAIAATVTPLLGLLGTVLGMMGAFDVISTEGQGLVASDFSKSISCALLTTAAGLTVAIPCNLSYTYFLSRVESMTLEMEKAGSEILFFFKEQRYQSSSEKKDAKNSFNHSQLHATEEQK